MDNQTTHFAPTNLTLDLDNGRDPRPVSIPSAEAISWDGAGSTTNCTVYSLRIDVECYAELRITGRSARRHTGGIWGWAAQVRFTGSNDDAAAWTPCVVTVGR